MQQGTPNIFFEDNHIIIVDKPHGWLVHGDKTNDQTIGDWLKQYIKQKYNKPGDVFLGTVHRLDRPVGGLMVFARTSKSLERLNQSFVDKHVKKYYQALVQNCPEKLSAYLVHWLRKEEVRNSVELRNDAAGQEWKKAETNYQVLGKYNQYFLIALEPITGRKHQLRAQMASIGSPIVGDLKYGSKIRCSDGNIALKCTGLEFIHPVKKERLCFKLDKPDWNI